MQVTLLALLATSCINLLLGLFVYLQNPSRQQNRIFALFAMAIAVWPFSMMLIIAADSAAAAGFFIRLASGVSLLIPLSYHFLCLSIADPGFSFLLAVRRNALVVISNLVFISMCFAPAYLRSVTMPPSSSEAGLFPAAHYGWMFPVYNVYWVTIFPWILWRFSRMMRASTGMRHIELQYVLLGMIFSLAVGIPTNILIPWLTGSSQMQPLGPISCLVMSVTIAYGIATRRILDAADVLRRVLAYGMLAACMTGVFLLTHAVVSHLGPTSHSWQMTVPGLLGALVVAFSLNPIQSLLFSFTSRVFSTSGSTRLANAVQSVTRSLQSISTLSRLVEDFARTISDLVGTERVVIFLSRKQRLEQIHPPGEDSDQDLVLPGTAHLPVALAASTQPVVADTLLRERPTAEVMALRQELKAASAAMAIGIHSRGALTGVILLGPRVSGKIYGASEQRDLQVLCDQFGVAIENSRLYTESIQSRRHNETLLNSLVNGVVAVDLEGLVTMINPEASRICRLRDEPQNRRLAELPGPIAEALMRTLQTGTGERDIDIDITFADGTTTPIRMGTAPFHDQHDRIIGSLAVLSDQTMVKKLESQIRRTDRLASVGTLAAGMAHEIKNPLVAINTFTQLLPDRFEDAEFRSTFTQLMRHEVQRMNSLVNQLLHFARPAPPLLAPVHVADVVSHSLLLMEQQIQNHRVVLDRHIAADGLVIRADANQLEQALVNLLLNALQSMQPEGRLTVSVRPAPLSDVSAAHPAPPPAASAEIQISDTGCGIPAENISRIFDPFFTTRGDGTGLGLSVAHGIIIEHRGTIEVASREGFGTTFTINLPLVAEEAGS